MTAPIWDDDPPDTEPLFMRPTAERLGWLAAWLLRRRFRRALRAARWYAGGTSTEEANHG